MTSSVALTYKDYDEERSNVQFDVVPMTSANFDATISAINAMSAAILAVQTENSLQSKIVTAQNTYVSRAKAEDKGTQREHVWLVVLEDATTHRLTTHRIPQADSSLVGTDTDALSLEDGVGATLKSTIEAIVKFPGTGNSVNVMSVRYSGTRS